MKSEISSSFKEFTRIKITRKVPKYLYSTKHHEALGKIAEKLSYEHHLVSLKVDESYVENEFYVHKYTIILGKTYEYPGATRNSIEAIFYSQDWGEKPQDEL